MVTMATSLLTTGMSRGEQRVLNLHNQLMISHTLFTVFRIECTTDQSKLYQ